tara:strand:- start:197415 stop:198590 length:1176 start_codon:yes stop_codon:yes gene_type:complete
MEDKVSMGILPKRDVVIVRGKGTRLWDTEGKEYIDCVGGHGTANIGHNHPVVVEALVRQAEQLMICPDMFYNNVRAKLVTTLAQVAPAGLDRLYLCNSGTEAVEAALKFARVATKRTGVIAAQRGFHGRTFGALSATWNPKYRKPFQPLVPGFSHVKYNDTQAIDSAINDGTAAVILEVVQGEGGVRLGTESYLKKVEALCRNRGSLLILDEVQTGFGRTGTMFACQHYDIQPDIICVAKAMAGGLPVGAVLCSDLVKEIPTMSHGSTFGGSPIICAAALGTLSVLQNSGIVQNAREMGIYFRERLETLDLRIIREIRGLGLMIGLELKSRVSPVLKGLMDHGILALPAGNTVLRFLPPLSITADDIDQVVDALKIVLKPLDKISTEESTE